jgi:hypothetical protein
MLALTCLAMTVGTALLALECNEYGWESEPASSSLISIPDLSGGYPTAKPAASPAEGAGVRNPQAIPLTEPVDLTGTVPAEPPTLAPLTPTVPVIAKPELPAIR